MKGSVAGAGCWAAAAEAMRRRARVAEAIVLVGLRETSIGVRLL
jgi:hypothetical protein